MLHKPSYGSSMICLLMLGACQPSGGGDGGDGDGGGGVVTGGGVVVFTLADGHVYRIRAEAGAAAEDLTAALDALAPRAADNWINISPDGDWLLLATERFEPGCAGFSCLAVVAADLSQGAAVQAGGALVHPEGFSAIASGGNLIVYPAGDGPHELDLWAVRRSGGGFSAPVLLTGSSSYAYNVQPAMSDDGQRVVFDCGPVPYSQEGTAICEVGADGAGLRVVLTVDDGPPGSPAGRALHHPDYAPDGSIVFEGDWGGEQIWRLDSGAGTPRLLEGDVSNDNSPCALADGRIASLWLGRPGGQGLHELKIAAADGTGEFVRSGEEDIADVGLGCAAAGGEAPDGDGAGDGDDTVDAGSNTGLFPRQAIWYRDISSAAVDAQSDEIIRWLEGAGGWGNGGVFQIDFSIEILHAGAEAPLREFEPTEDFYEPDCDFQPVPVPAGGALEGESGYACASDGDCHLIVVHEPTQRLYEMWRANIEGGEFYGGCLAVWDLTRVYGPEGRGEQCTSADAAGYPIAPLLFTADEVAAGRIDHAIRFVLPNARIREEVYVYPATHSTGATSGPDTAPPYGALLRLRADYPIADLPTEGARVVARALQRHGMYLADGGQIALTAQSDRFTAAQWDGLLGPHDLTALQVSDFEVMPLGDLIPYTGDCVREP